MWEGEVQSWRESADVVAAVSASSSGPTVQQ
jgi:hypothetical protein